MRRRCWLAVVFAELLAGAVHASTVGEEPRPLPLIPVAELSQAAEVPPTHQLSPAPRHLPQLVVVATRTPRPVADVAGAVSVVDETEIEERQASNLGEALGDLPGVAVEGGPRPDAEFINIRGLSGPRVLLVVDGARQDFYGGHRTNLLVEPELIKQIELLRGPASALWGSDAVGGVIAIRTRDARDLLPAGEPLGARLRVGYESAARERLGSAIGAGRLGDFDAVANFSWRDGGDYRLGNGETEPHSALRTVGTLAKFSWLPESPHQLGFTYQGFHDRGRSPSNPAIEVGNDNPLLDRSNDQRYLVARYAYEPDPFGRLRGAQLQLYRDELRIREDRVDQPRRDRTRFDTIGAGGQTTLALPGASLLTLGGEWYRDGADATRGGAPRPQYPDSRREVGGGFVQLEAPLGLLSVVPGLRYDRYRARSNTGVAPATDESAWSPKLGLVLRAGEHLRLRASYAEGFRAPALVELYSAGQHFLGNDFVPNPDLKPERARSLEAGFDFRSPGFGANQRLEFSGSIYRNRIRDFIELTVNAEVSLLAPQCLPPAPAVGCVNRSGDGSANPFAPPIFVGGTTTSRNLTEATLSGGELAATYALGPLSLSADYSRVRGRDDASGEQLATIPADTIHAALGARLPLGLRARLGFTHAFDQNRVPGSSSGQVTVNPSTPLDPLLLSRLNAQGQPPVPPTSGYSIWDLSIVWEPQLRFLREPRLVLGVDNLADAYYREHLNSIPSPGRNLRASFSTRF